MVQYHISIQKWLMNSVDIIVYNKGTLEKEFL